MCRLYLWKHPVPRPSTCFTSQNEWKTNAGPNQRKVNPNRNVRKTYYMNTGLLKHGFRVPASWGLKKMFSVHLEFPCRLWDSVFCHVWRGLFTTISYEISFQNCLKMWNCTLEFIYGSCMIILHHIFFLHFGILEQRASGAIDRTRWANITVCSFSRFISLIIHLCGNLQGCW